MIELDAYNSEHRDSTSWATLIDHDAPAGCIDLIDVWWHNGTGQVIERKRITLTAAAARRLAEEITR